MSSYLSIRIISKIKYEEYSNKYDELENKGLSSYDDAWDDVYKIINDNSFVLIWSSRSYRLYQTIQEAFCYTWKSLVIDNDGLRNALAILNKEYDYYKTELDYYNKNGFFKTEVNSKRVEDAVDYLNSIKSIVNEEKIDNIIAILSKTNNDAVDYSLYKEYDDELEDIVHAKTIIEALLIIIDYIDDNVLLVYDMD